MHNDASTRFDLPPDRFADWEVEALGAAVRVFLARSRQIPGYDQDDLIDECAIAWLTARDHYQPSRGAPRTLLNQVVRNTLIDLLRAATAQQRGSRYRLVPIDVPLDPDDRDSETLDELLQDHSPGAD